MMNENRLDCGTLRQIYQIRFRFAAIYIVAIFIIYVWEYFSGFYYIWLSFFTSVGFLSYFLLLAWNDHKFRALLFAQLDRVDGIIDIRELAGQIGMFTYLLRSHIRVGLRRGAISGTIDGTLNQYERRVGY